MDGVIIGGCKKYGLTASKSKWYWSSRPVEAWSPIGELGDEMTEHARLMTAVNTLMMDKQSPKDYIKSLAVRDVNDTLVLRKLRLM